MNLGRISLYIATLLSFTVGSLSAAGTYVVKPTETLYSIAKKHGVSVSLLQKTNKISDVCKLQIGQRLAIPSLKVSSGKTSKASLKSTVRQSKKYLRIVIDAGHGGKDKGAYWHGVRESDLNLRVAKKVETSLKYRGYPVVMTRRSDVFLTLSKRAQIGNRYRNSIFISIHFNATPNTRVRGAETFYGGGKQGHYLASAIQKELVSKLKTSDRGARLGRYTVIKNTTCPAVLVECGFISNTSERNRCKTPAYQSLCAQAIVAGIERYDRVY
ncbi:N-acetylmuramoyl-L-alanine amidase [Akkermansiaceae bacterium]|nr:N-acetylmuramoyl-L-alanine amidase [Akkermansiaceae bacterium]